MLVLVVELALLQHLKYLNLMIEVILGAGVVVVKEDDIENAKEAIESCPTGAIEEK